MTALQVECPKCKGAGSVQHSCDMAHMKMLRLLYDESGGATRQMWHDTVGIYRCNVCRQLWKVVREFRHVHGVPNSRSMWLKPGEQHDGWRFPYHDLVGLLEPTDLYDLPYVELLKHYDHDTLSELIANLPCAPGKA